MTNLEKFKSQTQKYLTVKDGSRLNKNLAYILSNMGIDRTDRKIYPGNYSGRGKYTSIQDNSQYLLGFLNREGYKYKKGNDAARGGRHGDYIQISRQAFNKFLLLRDICNRQLYGDRFKSELRMS